MVKPTRRYWPDGWNPAPVEVGSLSHDLQGFIHPRWCRISLINSSAAGPRICNGETRCLLEPRSRHTQKERETRQ